MSSNSKVTSHQVALACECMILFIGVPLAYSLGLIPIPIILVLLLGAASCWFALWRQRQISASDFFRIDAPRSEWRRILITFAIALPVMGGLLWLIRPQSLFALPRQEPKLWILLMLAYPLISVIPQELIYRKFLFARYAPLFGKGTFMILASAMLFSFAHIVFKNWPAVVLTLVGGYLFARTYQRTSSLALTAVEHALYGCAIFTLGWGDFLMQGTLLLLKQRLATGN